MKEGGSTIIEVLIYMAIVGIFVFIVAESIVNNRGATEKRAFNGAQAFLKQNDIGSRRLTCAGDSNHDGYGTCNVITTKGEKIILNCPTDFFDTQLFGASQCKEMFTNINLGNVN